MIWLRIAIIASEPAWLVKKDSVGSMQLVSRKLKCFNLNIRAPFVQVNFRFRMVRGHCFLASAQTALGTAETLARDWN
jgi:hypothetical protein